MHTMGTKLEIGIGFATYQGESFKTDVSFVTRRTFENLRPQMLLDLRQKVQKAALTALNTLVGFAPKPEEEVEHKTTCKKASVTVTLTQKDIAKDYQPKTLTLLRVAVTEDVPVAEPTFEFASEKLAEIADALMADSVKEITWALGEAPLEEEEAAG